MSVSTVSYRVKSINNVGNVSIGSDSDVSVRSGKTIYLGSLKDTVTQDNDHLY